MITTIIALAVHARRQLTRTAPRRWLGAGLTVALVATGVQAVAAGPAFAATAGPAGVASTGSASAPVSNAFAMGGGIGGSIDQRTGAFQVSVPLVNVAGRARTGLSLALSYDQSLAVLGTDRFGLGAGWTLGVPWVDTAGGVTVYPASGGSYAYDTGSKTGLKDYPLRDLTFARDPKTNGYTLTYLDGTVDRFDANGNLVEEVDRFGNPVDLSWEQSGQRWLLQSVTDSYGQVTKFDYGTASQVKIIAPVNAEGIAATTTLSLYSDSLQSVTGPLDQKTSFGYSLAPGSTTTKLLSSLISPTGEHTSVTYTQLSYEQSVVEASDVKVTDPKGVQVLAERHFTMNPAENLNQHNYTGYPLYNDKGPNALFNSGDFKYLYTTELSDSTSAVESTYNSLHLLVSQKVMTAAPGGGFQTSQIQTYTYPTVNSVAALPANYAKPASVTVAYGDPRFVSHPRTVTTSSSYNDLGLQTSATNAAGTTTTTTYGSYGLPLTQTVTGKQGATSVTTDTLSTDGKSVKTVTTAVGPTAATAAARTMATYSYNGFGQVTGESLAWAPGAKPTGDSAGPDQVDTTQQISVDTAAHTQTDVLTTAAGTPDAASTTTVTDLVTGQTLSQANPDHQTTTYTYDALGRPLTVTAPGNLTTTTSYPSPLVTDTTAPSGLETQTTTDVLGRPVKVTDNVSGQKLVPGDPTGRTLQTDSYSADGTRLTTSTPAGTTTTTFDPLGRPVQVAQPDGITETESYNDVTNTDKVSMVPAGAALTAPVSVSTEGFNDLSQPVSSTTSYTDGTPQAPSAETYDGLGRVASYAAGNVTATPDYGAAGGLQDGTTLTPGDTADFPGQPAQAATDNALTGALTAKTLTEQAAGQPEAAGQPAPGTTYTYDAAGRVATATTADKAVTSYTYTPAGQIATVTQPSGTKTTYTYDAKTGRLDQVDVHSGDGRTQQTGYTYYPATGQVKSVYDPADPADAISYAYDADGHLTEVDYPDGTSVKASYDDNGQLATTTDITGAVTSYTYNPDAGKPDGCGPAVTDLCSAVQKRGDTALASVTYSYDPMDRVHTITRGNGVTTTIGYTDASQVRTETVTAADGSTLRADSYSYDSHGNVATHTITTALPAPAAPGHAAVTRTRVRAATTTTTTAYGYDAYNRLISAKVYPGGTATGTPASSTSYTLDAAGNVTGQDTTTSAGTTHVVDTITPGGELTGRTAGGTAASQKFDADGNVTTDLVGNTYSYDPDGEVASATTPAGVTTVYTYWPDHTRRIAATTVGGVAHTITYHYATNGKIANETYAGGGPAVTASYLLAINREARTLDTAVGIAQGTSPGTGYYLTDAHGSVIAMIDATGQVTASYAYGDYGQPVGASPALLPTPAPDPAGNAAVNPFTYDGYYTNPNTGTQYLPARSYDPAQGRFLSADAADQFNRYQAFDTNPITNTDPTGQLAVPQIVTDFFAFALFLAFGVLSAGASVPVLAGVALGVEEASAITASVVLNAVSAATNIGAAATSLTLTADDAAQLEGGGFLSSTQRDNLNTSSFVLGTVAGATSFIAGGLDLAGSGAEEATQEADQAAAATTPAAPATGQVAAAATGAGADDLFALTPEEDSLFTSPAAAQQPAASPAAGADSSLAGEPASGGYSSSEEEGIAEIPASDNSPGTLAVPQTAPQNLDPATTGFTAELGQAGYNADLAPAGQSFAEAEQVPGGPGETSAAIVPTSTDPATATDNSTAGPNPLAQAVTTGIEDTLNGNTTAATPEQQANPLGENVPSPTIGISANNGQSAASEFPEDPFDTVLTFEVGF